MKSTTHLPDWHPDPHLLPELGEDPSIHPTALVSDSQCGRYVEIGAFAEITNCVIGDYSYVSGCHCSLSNCDIGNFTSIASHVRINPVNHPVDRPTQHHCTYRRRQYGFDTVDDDGIFAWRKSYRCQIGHDVWIGHGATVMPGVSVGTGAVIGSAAVVTRDVAPYSIVVGVPARPLRKRFDDPTIDRLLASEWWTWSHEKLKSDFQRLLDLDAFFKPA
jgi:phosphonate metabolism protein (transferase hexapeptide repeat family)